MTDSKELRCPTCERKMDPPARWFSGLIIWANIAAIGTLMAIDLPAPPASWVANCLSQVSQANAGSCYPPTGINLALGWLLYAGLLVACGYFVRERILDSRRQRLAWPRIKPRLIEDRP